MRRARLAKAAEISTGWSTERHMAAMRLASFTAGPTTVKSRRSAAADIAEEHLADMQPEIHVAWSAGCSAARRSFSAAMLLRAAAAASMAAAQARARSSAREDGEHAVADQLQHVAALARGWRRSPPRHSR